LAAKPFHVGYDVDRLTCPLHHPTACSRQTREHGLLSGAVLSHRCSGWWRLFGGCEAPGLDIYGVLTVWVPALSNLTWSKSFFTMACLSSIGVIMALRRASLVWLLCQTMMGWIQHSSTCCPMRVSSCGYIPSCQTPKAAASRGPGLAMLIRCRKPPGVFDRRPGLCPESRREVR
jgi:hypothetical protein